MKSWRLTNTFDQVENQIMKNGLGKRMTKVLRFVLIGCLFAATDCFPQQIDGFGGYTEIKGSTSGKWSIEKINDRYWFITPEGNAMYVLGVNHITATNPLEEGEALKNLKKWNFNSCGKSTEGWLLSEYPGFVPFTLHNTMHWLPADRFDFVDVFEPAFETHVEKTILERVEIGKKYGGTIGYVSTDTPRYDLDILRHRRGNDWVSFTRQLPAESSGKQAYINFLRKKYNDDFQIFQSAYRLSDIDTFEALLDYDFQHLELTRPPIKQDDQAFLTLIVERIYGLTHTYFKRFAPSALLLSDTFKMHDHPEDILKLAGKFFDVISLQAGPTTGPDVGQGPDESEFDPNYWKRIYTLTSKPIMLSDHGFSFHTQKYPRTLWHQFSSEKDAADFYNTYVKQVIEEPYIIGYIKCQYKNRYDPLRTLLKQGILKDDGFPYPLLEKELIKTNAAIMNRLYQ